jgi:high-affinity nickel permease
MGLILYFAFGALNICLLYTIFNWYRRETGLDLFPGRENEDRVDIITSIIGYFISGPFGTIMIILFAIFLYNLWTKYYRKK